MTNLLRSGMDWLATQLKTQASSSVTYSRGTQSLTLAATLGRHRQADLGDQPGAEVDVSLTVMTFDAADLLLGGVLIKPERRDVVSFTDHGVAFEFEVMPLDGERCWKESDAFGKRLEIRLKVTARTPTV